MKNFTGKYRKKLAPKRPFIKSGRGSVGRNWRNIWRYRNDEEFKKRRMKHSRKSRRKNKHKYVLWRKLWTRKLNEFVGRSCERCGNLLHFGSKGLICRKCLLAISKINRKPEKVHYNVNIKGPVKYLCNQAHTNLVKKTTRTKKCITCKNCLKILKHE
jgi:hypothetical protein